MEETKPKYYAIIPAYVRYDNELNADEKIIYAEITALSILRGYCFATNKYFSNLYNCHVNTISRRIKALEKHGYIKVEIGRDEKTKKYTRKIYLTENFIQNALTKIDNRTHTKTCEESLTNNGEYNNININDTNNVNNNILGNFDNIKLTDEQIETLKNEYGAFNTYEAIEYLSLYKKSSGKEYRDDYATIKLWVMDNVIRNGNNHTKKNKITSEIDYEEYYDVGN